MVMSHVSTRGCWVHYGNILYCPGNSSIGLLFQNKMFKNCVFFLMRIKGATAFHILGPHKLILPGCLISLPLPWDTGVSPRPWGKGPRGCGETEEGAAGLFLMLQNFPKFFTAPVTRAKNLGVILDSSLSHHTFKHQQFPWFGLPMTYPESGHF